MLVVRLSISVGLKFVGSSLWIRFEFAVFKPEAFCDHCAIHLGYGSYIDEYVKILYSWLIFTMLYLKLDYA